jgi:tRNA(Arg) A34 adenosine deaminase TadA
MEEVFSFELEKILLLNPTADPPLIKLRAVVVHNRREIGTILKTLSSELEYLKRIKHLEDGVGSLILLKDEDHIAANTDVVDVDVPAVAPLTQEQVQEWSKRFWPVGKSMGLSVSLIPLFDDVEKIILEKWMKRTWEIVEQRNSQAATIIVDPRTDSCVAEAVSKDCRLLHSTMVAIKEAGQAIQDSKASGVESVLSSDDTYLCTGFDVFLTHEPCSMCAMALLHSRVRRVFWDVPYPERGALGSVVRLHTLPNVNHRYKVFRKFFPTVSREDLGGCYRTAAGFQQEKLQ